MQLKRKCNIQNGFRPSVALTLSLLTSNTYHYEQGQHEEYIVREQMLVPPEIHLDSVFQEIHI